MTMPGRTLASVYNLLDSKGTVLVCTTLWGSATSSPNYYVGDSFESVSIVFARLERDHRSKRVRSEMTYQSDINSQEDRGSPSRGPIIS